MLLSKPEETPKQRRTPAEGSSLLTLFPHRQRIHDGVNSPVEDDEMLYVVEEVARQKLGKIFATKASIDERKRTASRENRNQR